MTTSDEHDPVDPHDRSEERNAPHDRSEERNAPRDRSGELIAPADRSGELIAPRDRSEERIAELLERLPPPPAGWTQAAIDLPAARAALDDLVERALADRAARDAVLADLEAAVRAVGVEPRPRVVAELRARLGDDVSPEPGSSGA